MLTELPVTVSSLPVEIKQQTKQAANLEVAKLVMDLSHLSDNEQRITAFLLTCTCK